VSFVLLEFINEVHDLVEMTVTGPKRLVHVRQEGFPIPKVATTLWAVRHSTTLKSRKCEAWLITKQGNNSVHNNLHHSVSSHTTYYTLLNLSRWKFKTIDKRCLYTKQLRRNDESARKHFKQPNR